MNTGGIDPAQVGQSQRHLANDFAEMALYGFVQFKSNECSGHLAHARATARVAPTIRRKGLWSRSIVGAGLAPALLLLVLLDSLRNFAEEHGVEF
jgi:hypothetical protein